MPRSKKDTQEAQLREAARDTAYHHRVQEALSNAYARASERPALPVDIDTARIIIFSDQHKGARNGADDFRECERAYNAALAYYYALGYTLVELGDVEELWEERPATVLEAYRYTIEQSARFFQAGRYIRIWGNHDDIWSFEGKVKNLLSPFYGPRLEVHEGVRLDVQKEGRHVGFMFLVHGHQGTVTSDRWARFSRLPVRYVWRNVQRVFRTSLNTPATDWLLREKHNMAMHAWARRQPRVVLVAGHTHRPVFQAATLSEKLTARLAAAESALTKEPANEKLHLAVAEIAAELAWTRTQDRGRKGPEGTLPVDPLRYFNTGCCSYLDGDITGLEIANGRITLVRWPNDEDRPKPRVLETHPLAALFG